MSSPQQSIENPFDPDPCYNYNAPENVSDREFLDMLCEACKNCNMEEWDVVVAVCERIRLRLSLRGCCNLFTYSLQLKLKSLRERHNIFHQFKSEDGISFDPETKKFLVGPPYQQFLEMNNGKENECYRKLRQEGEPLIEKMDFLFHERCCALVPLERCLLTEEDSPNIFELEDEDEFSSIWFWKI